MRYVTKIAPVVAHGVEFTMALLVEHLLDDRRFIGTGAGVRASVRIAAAVRSDGPSFAVEESDWQLLRQAAEEPSHGYPTLSRLSPTGEKVGEIQIARELLPFIDAIAGATAEKPAGG